MNFQTLSDFQQPRDFGQKISAVFDFLRAHGRLLGRCLVLYALPVPLVGFIAAGVAQQAFFSTYQPASGLGAMVALGSSPGVLLSYIPQVLGYTLLTLTVYGYVLARLDTPATEAVEPARVGLFVRTHFLRSLGDFILLFILLVVATMLLLIPGIWLSVPLSLFFFVRLFEGQSFRAAVSRSVKLTESKWWATAGLLIVMAFIRSVLPLVVNAVGGVVMYLLSTVLNIENTTWPLLTYGWYAVNNLLSLALYTLLLLAVAFQYFHLVEVKEGRGAYSLLEQLGRPATAAPADTRRYQADEEGEY